MGDIDGVDLADLRAALDAVDGKKPTLRLAVAIGYLSGDSATELAARYGVSRATVYNWLDRVGRLAAEPPQKALVDADRPGRPSRLSAAERERLAATLEAHPESAGYDADAWTPPLVRRHVRTAFGVEYTERHVRDVLHDLGFAPGRDGGWERRG